MIISPNEISNKQIVKGDFRVEPNAVDFTVDDLRLIDSTLFYYSNDKSNVSHRKRIDLRLHTVKELQQTMGLPDNVAKDCTDEGWILSPGKCYDVTSNIYVEVPEGMAAVIVGRSTGNRNGIIVTSGIYDSGFKGNIGCVIHNTSGITFLAKGTFIAQLMFMKADSAGVYSGGYNTANGQHWVEVAKPEPVAKVEPAAIEPVVTEPVVATEVKVEPVVDPVVEPAVETKEAPVRPRRAK